MQKMLLPLAASCLFALTLASPAAAFCGFYVSDTDTKLYADATQVVLMRDGIRTVLSMRNDYKGPAEKFAMVIPVPVVLQKENVRTLPTALFDKVDKLGSPRLVEYWEQDPCSGDMWGDAIGVAFGAGGLGLQGLGAGGGGRDLGVKIEAKFAVDEYEIVILSAKDSGGLETWLRQEKYAIAPGAGPYLKPYVQSGMKFFVAKVDPARVTFDKGRAMLSPLRFYYDAETFTLPVRLGLINSSGTQDLIVNILARGQRFEVANYPNVTIPTNLDVTDGARARFGETYAALFDRTVATSLSGAVVTEYAWDAGTCDPCPGPTLDGDDTATLGADVTPSGMSDLSNGGGGIGLGALGNMGVRYATPKVIGQLPPEVIARVSRQSNDARTRCVATSSKPSLEGTMVVSYTISKDGSVKAVADGGGTLKDAEVRSCILKTFEKLSFPQPEGGAVKVTQPITVIPPPSGTPAPRPSFTGGSSSPYVLTRLHVRYAKDTMGQDLVFKAAPPIVGGRERMTDGVLERGSRPDSVNNFQARYALRHGWTGPITCKEPKRGRWGGPPVSDAGPSVGPASPSAPVVAEKTAFAPRGRIALASMLTGSAASDWLADSGAPDPAAATPLANDDAGAARGSATPAKNGGRGCAGCTVGLRDGVLGDGVLGDGTLPSAAGALGLLALLGVRRRSSRGRPPRVSLFRS